MHQNSPTGVRMLTDAEIEAIKPVRCERKVTDGQGLYLLVTPNGARHWRFRYSFAGKRQNDRSRNLPRGYSELGQITS